MSKLARENNTASKTVEADRLHTMFLAMADARAVLIKLADRLHNMMTLDALPLCKQQRFAKETLEIFVPLANRLGISTWKVQLENLCFKHLNPDQHTELSSKLVECFDEAMITSAIEKLEQALKDKNISFLVLCGRHKSLYSIHCKMLKYVLPSLPNLIRESFVTEYSSLTCLFSEVSTLNNSWNWAHFVENPLLALSECNYSTCTSMSKPWIPI